MNKKKFLIISAVLLLLVGAVICAVILGGGDGDVTLGESTAPSGESATATESNSATDTLSPDTESDGTDETPDTDGTAASEPSESTGETDADTAPDSETLETSAPSTGDSVSGKTDVMAQLGEGIELLTLGSYSGKYVEDGTDTAVENALCAVFRNAGTKTLQYAEVVLTSGGVTHVFAFSTIPAGAEVRAITSEPTAAFDLTADDLTVSLRYAVFFPEEPTAFEEQLELEVKSGIITVKNVSDEPIDKGFSVFYKNLEDETYVGGITYRVRIDGGLAAGESKSGFASHVTENSVIMFVQYDS